jgi:hypothetical protein
MTELQAEKMLLAQENKRLRARVRGAFKAGFWAYCGPANEVELEGYIKDEQEEWEEWSAKSEGGKG